MKNFLGWDYKGLSWMGRRTVLDGVKGLCWVGQRTVLDGTTERTALDGPKNCLGWNEELSWMGL